MKYTESILSTAVKNYTKAWPGMQPAYDHNYWDTMCNPINAKYEYGYIIFKKESDYITFLLRWA